MCKYQLQLSNDQIIGQPLIYIRHCHSLYNHHTVTQVQLPSPLPLTLGPLPFIFLPERVITSLPRFGCLEFNMGLAEKGGEKDDKNTR